MPMWFYYDGAGNKKGPINDVQLRSLVVSSEISQETILETDSGHKGKAGQVKGLFPAPKLNPFAGGSVPQTSSTPNSAHVSPGTAFCTNCGKPVSENAVACMSCGADPRAHRSFCRNCGVALNPNQVVCVRCGCGIKKGGTTEGTSGSTGCSKNKMTAGLLAIFLGGVGVHKFYMGSWGWGIIFIAAVLLTGGLACLITSILGLVEGIMFLVMSDESFEEKYADENLGPMKW